jgi:hypothetical protein
MIFYVRTKKFLTGPIPSRLGKKKPPKPKYESGSPEETVCHRQHDVFVTNLRAV